MKYEDLQIILLKFMKSYWKRVIAFDMETHVPDQRYLTGERILAISFARRIGGKFLGSNGIEIKTLFIEENTDDAEVDLLLRFGKELGRIKPICVLGYGIRQYDIPLLAIKKQYYGEYMKNRKEFWRIVDFVESALHIDLYHILKYKGYRKFDHVINSEEFASLPLKRTKNIVTGERAEKAIKIYELWEKNRDQLKEYVEGDVHDSLLIAEKILLEAG